MTYQFKDEAKLLAFVQVVESFNWCHRFIAAGDKFTFSPEECGKPGKLEDLAGIFGATCVDPVVVKAAFTKEQLKLYTEAVTGVNMDSDWLERAIARIKGMPASLATIDVCEQLACLQQ